MQICSSDSLANTTSLYPAAYRSDSPSPMNTTAGPAAWCASTRLRLQVPHTKQSGLPLGNSIRAPSGANVVAAVTTGIQPTPSASRAGSMKKPNPSDTTSTGMPAARARSANGRNAGVVRLGGRLRPQRVGIRADEPDLPGHQPPRPTSPASYAATCDSQSAVTNSAMSVSETSVWAIVPS